MNNVFIILVKPQLGQNIGSVARIMKNLNFKNLRIVNPRDGWPNQDVISTAAGADDIITNTKVFENVSEACNDLNYLFASSARKRDLNIKTLNLVNTVSFLNKTEFSRNDFKIGLLFGCESSGLSNEDLITANQLIYIPSNSDFMKKSIMENIKVLFNRSELSSQEIKTLNGIIKSLYEYNKQA